MKTAIVTGVGQDSSYLCELLLSKDYNVVSVSRRSTRTNNNMVEAEKHPNYKNVILDITDTSGVYNLIEEYKPDEFYNLAAQSHVGQSFKEPLTTLDIDGRAVVGILEAIRSIYPACKMYQANTSEMMGANGRNTNGVLTQDENTPFSAKSPYAAAKIYAHHMVKLYREAYGLHVSSGILFNHSSIRRGYDFVTRKITNGVARIVCGLDTNIRLGNITTFRDIGNASDYVEAMWLMLQQEKPDDYVIATGEAISIANILEFVCNLGGLDWENVYMRDEQFMRPSDVPYLCGDSSKARRVLGWSPMYTWKDTLTEMYKNDLEIVNYDIHYSGSKR